jgi:hypothetical protein
MFINNTSTLNTAHSPRSANSPRANSKQNFSKFKIELDNRLQELQGFKKS